MAFGDSGKWLASGGEDNFVVLWDVRRRRPTAFRYFRAPIAAVTVSAAARQVAAVVGPQGRAGVITTLSIPSLTVGHTMHGRWALYSPDGQVLYHDDAAGHVVPLDTRTWKPAGTPLAAGSGPGGAAISPDGRTLATAADDGTTRLTDLRSGRQTVPALSSPGRPIAVAFLEHGDRLLTLSSDRRAQLWDLNPRSWASRACALAGRTLTRTEWRDVLPERPYAPACRR